MVHKVNCMCNAVVEKDVPEVFDLDADPAVGDMILDGSFLSLPCPECGAVLKPEFPARVVWAARKIDLYLVPELDRTSFEKGETRAPADSSVAIGYGELAEKFKLATRGLDAGAVEVMKYYLYLKADEQAPEADISIHFSSEEGGDLLFAIEGLKPDEVAIARVSRAQYEKTLADLPRKRREEPFSEILAGQYVSVLKALDW